MVIHHMGSGAPRYRKSWVPVYELYMEMDIDVEGLNGCMIGEALFNKLYKL